MRIMSLNAWGGTLHGPLLRYLASEAPEVLCLQEVIHSPDTGKADLIYRDGDHVLPQRANLFTEVAAVLPEHAATFCPAAQGMLWDGETPVPSRWGLATFVHGALPVIGQAQGFVHKGYAPDGFGAHPRSRSAHAVRVFDQARGRAVSIAQMHGLRDLRGKMDTPERAAQALRFRELLAQVAEPGDLRVACGDFNVEPGSETLRLLEASGLTELVTQRGFAGTRSAQYAKPGKFADYMLVNDAKAVRGFTVVRDPEVSDHCPLLLEV
ncbi:endonuclease/exonuclease/phosphatase family protein [Salipiger mangrovisoli]|uniref:Endonuclease/exonuclease/phosphatase family protein n=1 Tax=Salipiger mangrovisoli TaxID=2865933 RepID=A0ABR9WVI4_9RHOB|nr:endonuclease/exonuclease/phosphatase family protein [Salipiger mangrovisoli]MBE9635287.1 endonuclease/exonuclease/phosphatase family protein [Salipiger mangrovisoli]